MKAFAVLGLFWFGVIYAETINYENEGNLQPFHDIGCTGLDGLTNKFTPADIYLGIYKCLTAGEYQKAAGMSAVASVYGKFDMKRVEKASAHQALEMMKINYFSNLDQNILDALAAESAKITDMADLACPTLYRIGKPDYHPVYMIEHGLKVFYDDPNSDGLVADFNGDLAWQDILDNYAKCPSTNTSTGDNQQADNNALTEPIDETSDSGAWFVKFFCQIGETYYALMSDANIHYATEAGGLVGYITEPNAEECVFDMIIDEVRHCVDANYDISFNSDEILGACEPCYGEQCIAQ